MDIDSISDSEDDSWLAPWPSPSFQKPAGESELENKTQVPSPSRSVSSDDLATDFAPRVRNKQVSKDANLASDQSYVAVIQRSQLEDESRWAVSLNDSPNQSEAQADININSSPLLQDVSLVDALQPQVQRNNSPSIEESTTTRVLDSDPPRRALRPRTYQQLHTYEYEHAKYVMECRAAGIKPVRFDGNRYREMDTLDADFVPAPNKSRREQEHSSSNPITADVNSSASPEDPSLEFPKSPRGRKRYRPSKFRDPRNLDAAKLVLPDRMVPDTQPSVDPFDFPDRHWHGDSNSSRLSYSSTPIMLTENDSSPHQRGSSSNDLIYIEDEQASSTSSIDDIDANETLERARFAKRLKGVLPPSFLSRVPENFKRKQVTHPKLAARQQNHGDGKGVAKKKIVAVHSMSKATSPDEEEFLGLPDTSGRPVSPANMNSGFQEDVVMINDADNDISEGEENFDRMLQRGTRTSTTHPRVKRITSARKSLQRMHLIRQAMAATPAPQARDLRLLYRIYKQRNIVAKGESASKSHRKTSDQVLSRSKDQLPSALHQTSSNGIRAVMSSHNQKPRVFRSRLANGHRTALGLRSSIPSNDTHRTYIPPQYERRGRLSSRDARGMAKKSSSSDSATSVSSLFDSDDSATAESTSRTTINKHDESVKLARVRPSDAFRKLTSRTFRTHLEHEKGHASRVQSGRARHSSQKYLQRFDDITNIFSQEDETWKKISHWQQQIRSSPGPGLRGERRQIDAKINPVRKSRHSQSRLGQKSPLVQQSIVHHLTSPVLAMPEASAETSFQNAYQADPYFRCLPPIGFSFESKTFVGGQGLFGVLSNNNEGLLRSCYLADRQYTIDHDMQDAVRHGLSYVEDYLKRLDMLNDGPNQPDAEIYNFLRFSASCRDIETLWFIAASLHKLIEHFAIKHSISPAHERLARWLQMFHLVILCKIDQIQATSCTAQALESELQRIINRLFEECFERTTDTTVRHSVLSHKYSNLQDDPTMFELWVVLFHVANGSAVPFWQRINLLLSVTNEHDSTSAEWVWSTIFKLAGVCGIDLHGQYLSEKVLPNWSIIERLWQHVIGTYQDASTAAGKAIDVHVNVMLRRTHGLITIWRWPGSSTLLGHGRSGGVLYELFLRTLHLHNLPTESRSLTEFPSFLSRLGESDSLQPREDDKSNCFGIFLKVVVLGLNQYICNLESNAADIVRMKKRGLGVVDKFATLGRLNYSATEQIDYATFIEIQNRYSLELAVYWAAADWKDRGIRKLIQASIEAMPGSHLMLRKMQVHAWQIATKMQLDRSEENALEMSAKWLTANVQATVSDVLQFRHQSRLQSCDAKNQARIEKNVKHCHDHLVHLFERYHDVLSLQNSSTTTKRLYFLWMNDILRPILQLHESFILANNPTRLLERVFAVLDLLIERHVATDSMAESQEYGAIDLSQNDCDLIDYDALLQEKFYTLLGLLFRFLTNLTSQEQETPRLKLLAKGGLLSFSSIILHLQRKGQIVWQSLFDDTGLYSWRRLLDRPIKDIMLPYYLAILYEKGFQFSHTMKSYTLSIWYTSMVKLHVRDSLAALTNVLINDPGCILYHVDEQAGASERLVISGEHLDTQRANFLRAALRALGQHFKATEDRANVLDIITSLITTLRISWQTYKHRSADLQDRYAALTQQTLSSILQFCSNIVRAMSEDQLADFHWLCDTRNVPQSPEDFSPLTFRAFAEDDIGKKSVEIAIIVAAHCDTEILESKDRLTTFLVRALTNEQISPALPPMWQESIAILRKHVVIHIFGSFLLLTAHHPAAALYVRALALAFTKVYYALAEQSWNGHVEYISGLYHEVCDVIAAFAGNLDSALQIMLQCISEYLSKYACVQAQTNHHESLYHRTLQSTSITEALQSNLHNSWSLLGPNDLYHTRRQITLPLLSASDLAAKDGAPAHESFSLEAIHALHLSDLYL